MVRIQSVWLLRDVAARRRESEPSEPLAGTVQDGGRVRAVGGVSVKIVAVNPQD
jgi:hypothetical protein